MAYKKNIDRDVLINGLVKMVTIDKATNRTLLNFLMNDIGYETTAAYDAMKEARAQIANIYKENLLEYVNKRVSQLEEEIEILYQKKDRKLALEYVKELNKMLGVYAPEKHEHTHEFRAKFPGFEEDTP